MYSRKASSGKLLEYRKKDKGVQCIPCFAYYIWHPTHIICAETEVWEEG